MQPTTQHHHYKDTKRFSTDLSCHAGRIDALKFFQDLKYWSSAKKHLKTLEQICILLDLMRCDRLQVKSKNVPGLLHRLQRVDKWNRG